MIFTTNYNSKKMKERVKDCQPVYGISRYPYRWFSPDTLKGYILELAPTVPMLKCEDDMEVFEPKYLRYLTKNKKKVVEILKKLDAENATICCFEKISYDCHRSLIKKFVDHHELNIEVREL